MLTCRKDYLYPNWYWHGEGTKERGGSDYRELNWWICIQEQRVSLKLEQANIYIYIYIHNTLAIGNVKRHWGLEKVSRWKIGLENCNCYSRISIVLRFHFFGSLAPLFYCVSQMNCVYSHYLLHYFRNCTLRSAGIKSAGCRFSFRMRNEWRIRNARQVRTKNGAWLICIFDLEWKFGSIYIKACKCYLYSGDGHPCATHNNTAPSSCATETWFVCSTMLGEIIPRWSVNNLFK